VELLRSWRQDNPSLPLDQHVHSQEIPLNSPLWERNRVSEVVMGFTKKDGITESSAASNTISCHVTRTCSDRLTRNNVKYRCV
jgi:hypothetical protein